MGVPEQCPWAIAHDASHAAISAIGQKRESCEYLVHLVFRWICWTAWLWWLESRSRRQEKKLGKRISGKGHGQFHQSTTGEYRYVERESTGVQKEFPIVDEAGASGLCSK